jgi:ribosomal protein S18 acetylase RimI-like enzyme
MNSSVTLRSAQPSDEHALGRLGAMLVAEHHDFDPKRFIAPVPELPSRYGKFLVGQLERPEMVVLVAEQDGGMVGYAFAGLEGNDYMALRGPAGVIYDLIVDPAHRRQGIGGRLLDAAIAAVEALGAPRVVLFSAEKNAVAHAMFEHSGFRRTMIEMTREVGAAD